MKLNFKLMVFCFIVLVLAFFSNKFLKKQYLKITIFEKTSYNIHAYNLKIPVMKSSFQITPLKINSTLLKTIKKNLNSKNISALEHIAKKINSSKLVIVLFKRTEFTSKLFIHENEIDNLTFFDKLYLRCHNIFISLKYPNSTVAIVRTVTIYPSPTITPVIITSKIIPTPIESTHFNSSNLNVEILNGCGAPKIANQLAGELKRFKYIHLLKVGNANSFQYNHSIIETTQGISTRLMNLAELLNISPRFVLATKSVKNKNIIIIILGNDYPKILEGAQ